MMTESTRDRIFNADETGSRARGGFVTLIAFIVSSVTVSSVLAQDGAVDQSFYAHAYLGIPESGARNVQGPVNCALCHGRTAGQEDANLSFDPAYMSKWIRLDEQQIWQEDDKHRQAYEVLRNDRSQKMAKILGIIDRQTGESLIHQDVRCLSCHTSVPVRSMRAENNLVTTETVRSPIFNFGVSCEGCHGPAGNLEGLSGWVGAHSLDSEFWRSLSTKDKFEKHGFWDVRTPRTQAKICLSCHIGNVEQGKIITHEMYAAGHPPLPSFELATFVRQQPQHWRFAEDKEPEIRDEFLGLRGETYQADELYRSKSLLTSSLVTVSEAMKLNSDLLDENIPCPTDKPAWPELANFSCFACHHDLKRDGWRKSRPLTRTPGRPTLHEWPTAMAEVAAEFLGHGDEFRTRLKSVYAAMNLQPFGQPGDVQDSCRELAELTDQWAIAVQQTSLKANTDGARLLKLIAMKGVEQEYDYDSARQLVWAYERVLHDIQLIEKRSAQDARDDHRPKWSGWFEESENLTPQQEILKSLADVLMLDLRLGEDVEEKLPGESRPRRRVEVELDITLAKTGAYEPAAVQAAFKELLSLLPNP